MTKTQIEALTEIRDGKGLLHGLAFHIMYHGPEIAELYSRGLFDVGAVETPTGSDYPAVYLTDAGRAALNAFG